MTRGRGRRMWCWRRITDGARYALRGVRIAGMVVLDDLGLEPEHAAGTPAGCCRRSAARSSGSGRARRRPGDAGRQDRRAGQDGPRWSAPRTGTPGSRFQAPQPRLDPRRVHRPLECGRSRLRSGQPLGVASSHSGLPSGAAFRRRRAAACRERSSSRVRSSAVLAAPGVSAMVPPCSDAKGSAPEPGSSPARPSGLRPSASLARRAEPASAVRRRPRAAPVRTSGRPADGPCG